MLEAPWWHGYILLVACGPHLHLVRKGETIQVQCGVRSGTEVSESHALCIARLGGLESGARPWVVKEDSDARMNLKV